MLAEDGIKVSVGSSPRMWGTHNHTGFESVGEPVHPHACGEHVFCGMPRRKLFGSSPRMWGTHLRLVDRHLIGRFIPTHVGNTVDKHVSEIITAVHPHACGEHSYGVLLGL